MNYPKWRDRAEKGEISPLEGLAKLVEEVGEVGKAISEEGIEEVISELDQVVFIAQQMGHSLKLRYAREGKVGGKVV